MPPAAEVDLHSELLPVSLGWVTGETGVGAWCHAWAVRDHLVAPVGCKKFFRVKCQSVNMATPPPSLPAD